MQGSVVVAIGFVMLRVCPLTDSTRTHTHSRQYNMVFLVDKESQHFTFVSVYVLLFRSHFTGCGPVGGGLIGVLAEWCAYVAVRHVFECTDAQTSAAGPCSRSREGTRPSDSPQRPRRHNEVGEEVSCLKDSY